jgi:predicted dehydrogenase
MIKIGIVGAGFIGNIHSGVYQCLPDVKVVSVCDIRSEKAEALAGKFNAKKFTDFKTMLKDSELDMVDVCLPTFMHKEYAIKAANAGCNVLCEKPMALNLKEAGQMIKACKKNKIKFMVAHCIRFWPEYQYLYDVVKNGEFGELRTIAMSRLSPTPIWSWRNWVLDAPKSGLATLDLHIHDTDYLLYLLGKPQSVSSAGRREKRGWSHVYSVFRYKNNVSAFIEGGWDYPENFPFQMAYRARFEKAAVVFNSTATPSVSVYQVGKKTRYPKIKAPDVGKLDAGGNISVLGGYYNEIRYFIDCLKKNKAPKIVTPEDARDSLALVLQEIKSLNSNKEVSLK